MGDNTVSIACLIGSQTDVIAANAQIEANCGIPCPGTSSWDIPRQGYEQDFWFITMPPASGWNEFSQDQMMHDVVDVSEAMSQSSWFPPIPIPPGDA
jgi:hypothetical protein